MPETAGRARANLTPKAVEKLSRFAAALLAENADMNLTAARDAAAVGKHVDDSLELCRVLAEHRPRSLLDLGSGGGFPGLVVAAAWPELRVTVVDSIAKKAAALERIAAAAGLENVSVRCGRAEALAHDPALRERFDAATARAVAALPVLLEWVAGFVRVGGCAWLFKSMQALPDEQRAARSAAAACGLKPIGAHAYRLAGESADRALAGYRKLRPLDRRLPRPGGEARKRPL